MSIRQPMALLVLSVAALCAAGHSRAQGSTGAVTGTGTGTGTVKVTLAQVLAAARDNFDVAVARANVDAARGDVAAADHAPLPQFTAKTSSIDLQNGLGGGNLLRDKRIDKSVGLDWTWERGDKRALRTLAAQKAVDAAGADLDEVRNQQQLAALGAYFDLLAAQERIDEQREIARSATQLAETAQRRVKAGDLAAQDANRSEIEARRARVDLDSAQLDRERASLVLAGLIGQAAHVGLASVAGSVAGSALPAGAAPAATALTAATAWPPAVARPEVADLAALIERRADVRAAEARVQAAQAARDGALALKKSDITWGSSFDHYPGTSTRQVELRLQMPLQWGYEQQGEIARAEAQLAQARDAVGRTRLLAANELQRLRQEAAANAARAQAFDEDIVPRARRAAEQAELAYSKGALPLTDLIDARRTLRATLLDALAARADFAKADGAWKLRVE